MSRKDDAKREFRQRVLQIIIGSFLVFLMVISIVQFANNGNSGSSGSFTFKNYVYTPIQITAGEPGFSLKVDGRKINVHYRPFEQNLTNFIMQNPLTGIAKVDMEDLADGPLHGATYTLTTFDPEINKGILPLIERVRIDFQEYLPNTIDGVLKNSTQYSTLPVINCSNAVNGVAVIELLVTNSTSNNATITRNGSCIILSGGPLGVLAAKDVLLLSYYGALNG